MNHRFTFLSDQGSSVIDYFLCSLDFESCVCSMDILCRIESSHAPVVLKVCGSLPTVYVEKMLEINYFKIKWDGAKEQEFRNFLTTDYAVVCLNEALALLENNLEAAVKKMYMPIVRSERVHAAGSESKGWDGQLLKQMVRQGL